jgi:hypothetical protein
MDLRFKPRDNFRMSKAHPIFEGSVMVRTSPEAKRSLDHIVADLKALKGLRFLGKKITQDALVNASWMWLEELGAAAVEEGISKHLSALEGSGVAEAKDEPHTTSSGEVAEVIGSRTLKMPGINAPAQRSKKDPKDKSKVADPPRGPSTKR